MKREVCTANRLEETPPTRKGGNGIGALIEFREREREVARPKNFFRTELRGGGRVPVVEAAKNVSRIIMYAKEIAKRLIV